MAPVNMPTQAVQLRQQVIIGTAPLKQLHKQGKRYGRRPVRTANGEKLLAGRRHRAVSGNQFDENIWDMVDEVRVPIPGREDWTEDVDQPTKPSPVFTPQLKNKEPAVRKPRSDSEQDFPTLKEEMLASLAGGRKERTLSEMSAGSFTDVLQRQTSEEKFLDQLGSPKLGPKKNLNKIDEEIEEVWMVVGQNGRVAPEKSGDLYLHLSGAQREEASEGPEEADPYDAFEMKDSRRKPVLIGRYDYRPMGDAHTGRRFWKVDPSERDRNIEAAQLRKKEKKNGGGQLEVIEEDAGTEQKKRTRLERKKENRVAKAEEAETDDSASTTTEEDETSEQSARNGKKPHTKKLRKRLLSK